MEHIVTKTLDGIMHAFPESVWDYYFTNMIIRAKDETNCNISLYQIDGAFTIPMTVQAAVDSINDGGEVLMNELLTVKDFPKSKFLSIRPPKLNSWNR